MKRFAKRRAAGAYRRSVARYGRALLPLSGFPDSKLVRLRYVETINITEAVLATANHLFSCNSIYDPNTSGTGHQPYGHDQWAALYNHYEVLGSKIRVLASSASATGVGVIVGIQLSDDTSVAINTNELMENNKSKYRICVAGNPPTVLTQKWSQRRHFPGKRGDDNLSAMFGANPSEQMFYNIYLGSGNTTSAMSPVSLQVQVDYIVKVYERKQFSQS